MPATPSAVSFIVRRPTPSSRRSSSGPESDGPFKIPALPRHLASAGSSTPGSPLAGSPRTFSSRGDSGDEGETGIVFTNGPGTDSEGHHSDLSDEENFIASLKQPGRQRFHQKEKKVSVSKAPLVIPAQPNPDWREAARRRRAACSRIQPHSSRATPSFVPDSALATTGADGSVGGLGTRDTINSGPQLSGLQINKETEVKLKEDDIAMQVESADSIDQPTAQVVEETEDQRALRAILAGEGETIPVVDIIAVPPLSEADALRQDVRELPEVATPDDYERVPISVFGAAMLRGMGWTDGAVAPKSEKRRKNGLTELYLPQTRPALLGIGAKEREQDDDGSGKKKSKGADMRYIPVARKESGRSESRSRSGTVSRRSSRSPSRREREDHTTDRKRGGYDDRERRRERDRDEGSRRRTKDYDERERDRKDYRDRDRNRDWDVEGDRTSNPYRDREREYDQRDRTREQDRQSR